MKNYSLLLASSLVTAWPYKTLESLRLGFALQSRRVRDPGAWVRRKAVAGELTDLDLHSAGATSYELLELEQVAIECNWFNNAVALRKTNGTSVRFRLLHRADTVVYRRTLRRLYPGKYVERGFPKSRVTRVLKS